MRRLVIPIVVALLVSGHMWAQETPAPSPGAVKGDPYSCPVDGRKFTHPQSRIGSLQGGVDSDHCTYEGNGDWVLYSIVVCPRCNYAAIRDTFPRAFNPKQRQAILKATADSSYRGVTEAMTEIPPWERAELALKCSKALDEPLSMQIQYLHMASWMARVKAVRPATRAYPIASPILVDDFVRLIGRKVERADTPKEKNRLKLHTAMIHQRGGDVTERDKVLAELDQAAAKDPLLKTRIDEFRKLNVVEAGYQKRALELIDQRLAGEDVRPDERLMMTYIKADTLRRLGLKEDAIKTFREVRRLMRRPSQLRTMTDYLLTRLAPGEPLPKPEAPKPETPKETETPKTPEDPEPSPPAD